MYKRQAIIIACIVSTWWVTYSFISMEIPQPVTQELSVPAGQRAHIVPVSYTHLTNKDYNENGLSELLALYGSAYNVNIKIFNDLQHTITGWPGGKPNADDTYRPERAKPFPKRVVIDRKSTRLNSSHIQKSRMPSSA